MNFFRPRQNSAFKLHNPLQIKILARLRVGRSHLKEHKFKHNFQNSVCSCNNNAEYSIHFMAEKKKFSIEDFFSKCDQIRSFQVLLNKLHSIDSNVYAQKLVLLQRAYLVNRILKSHLTEAAVQRCFYEKIFRKYAANLQENTHAEVWFQ